MPFIYAPLPASPTHALRRKRQWCRCAVVDADVVVVGGGVGGLATARALKRIGRDVTVLEREQEDRPAGQAIGLWTNAWRALEALQVDMSELRSNIRNTSAEIVRASDGRRLGRVDIPKTTEFRYVEREQLLNALRAGLTNVKYGVAVENVVVNEQGGFSNVVINGNRDIVRARLVIGADGIRSIVREKLGLENTVRNASYRAWRGSATVKPGDLKTLEQGQILQVWGIGERIGVTRVRDDLVHWFYTGVKREDNGKFGSDEEELKYVKRRVNSWGCEVASEVASLPQRAFTVTRCGDRLMWPLVFGKGPVTLVGDAAHLSTPNLGQGAALALEDAVEIAYSLRLRSDDSDALRAYERARWARNLSIGLRSAGAGLVAHLSTPPLVEFRDSLVVPVVMSQRVLLGSTYWQAPQL